MIPCLIFRAATCLCRAKKAKDKAKKAKKARPRKKKASKDPGSKRQAKEKKRAAKEKNEKKQEKARAAADKVKDLVSGDGADGKGAAKADQTGAIQAEANGAPKTEKNPGTKDQKGVAKAAPSDDESDDDGNFADPKPRKRKRKKPARYDSDVLSIKETRQQREDRLDRDRLAGIEGNFDEKTWPGALLMMERATKFRKRFDRAESCCCGLGLDDLLGVIPLAGGVLALLYSLWILCSPTGRAILKDSVTVYYYKDGKGGKHKSMTGTHVWYQIFSRVMVFSILREIEIGNLVIIPGKVLKRRFTRGCQRRSNKGVRFGAKSIRGLPWAPSRIAAKYEAAVLEFCYDRAPSEELALEVKRLGGRAANPWVTLLAIVIIVTALIVTLWAFFAYDVWTKLGVFVDRTLQKVCTRLGEYCFWTGTGSVTDISAPNITMPTGSLLSARSGPSSLVLAVELTSISTRRTWAAWR